MVISVNDLPDDILARIFDDFPKTQDSFICLGKVCTKWNDIVEKQMGIFMIAGTEDSITVSEVKDKSRKRVLEYSSEIVNIFDIPCEDSTSETTAADPPPHDHDHGDTNDNIIPPPPVINYEELQTKLSSPTNYVKKLCFIGNLPVEIPCAYLSMCETLSGLHFHLSSLVGIQLPLSNLTLDIPTLRSFIIDSYGLAESWKYGVPEIEAKKRNVLDIAVGLLDENTFPHLELLVLDIPYCLDKEKAFFTAISAFLERHHESIKSFCYHQGFVVSDDDNETNDETNDENGFSLSDLASCSKQLKKVSLKEIHIGLYTPQESAPLWINFMIHQNQLEKMIFTGDKIPFLECTVQANQSTLTTLIMEVRDNVDFESLKGCVHLRKLSLFGKSEDEEEEEEDDNDEDDPYFIKDIRINILNMELLPTSLENLRINGLKIDRNSIAEIICSGRWTQLQYLELIECGVEQNLGVRIQTMAHILEKKSLKWFYIECSLNRKSVYERNLPESLQMLVYALKCNSISKFAIQGHFDAIRGIYNHSKHLDEIETLMGSAEVDLFTFPEEINPTGYHRKEDTENKDGDENSENGSVEGSSSEDSSDDSSYVDLPSDSDNEGKENGCVVYLPKIAMD